ncbi:hypothetical protein [Streptococcus marimammalium]|uniref:hypothetical protein n=1 Tax=Streptococcus marimammalium TaxID=269666 RepID=UPI00037659F7|nr:hypothetical protein [Streptococcus marimammalium]
MFKEKKFLLTHIWLRGFSGAEINILELALYLQSQGAVVEVFTYLSQSPLKNKFEEKNIKIIDDINHKFEITNYDMVFVSQNIIPPQIIRELGQNHEKYPRFVFLHMAALPSHVLEQPFIHDLEQKISSASLVVSKEIVKKNLSRFFKQIPNLHYYPNPVPKSYTNLEHRKKTSIKSILVISNHPPKEILEIEKLLIERKIKIDYFGVWSQNYQLVNPELINKYDCVIGIGKNVQYCLVMGKPIYVYDHFKGPGYLNEDNFILAKENNFSGRGFEKNIKTSEEIVKEILSNYKEAQIFHNKIRNQSINKYLISNVFSKIYKSVNNFNKKIEPFDSNYIEYVNAINLLLKNTVVRLENDSVNLWQSIHKLENVEKEKEKEIDSLKLQINLQADELKNIKKAYYYKINQFFIKFYSLFINNKLIRLLRRKK